MLTVILHVERTAADETIGDDWHVSSLPPHLREYYAARRNGSRGPWHMACPSDADYFRLTTLESAEVLNNAPDPFAAATIVDQGCVYLNGMVYATKELLEKKDMAAKRNEAGRNEVGRDEAARDRLTQFADNGVELLVVSRGGAVNAFDKERDVMLRRSRQKDVWDDVTSYYVARALTQR